MILFPSIPHPPVVFASLLLALWVRAGNQFSVRDYTFYLQSSLVHMIFWPEEPEILKRHARESNLVFAISYSVF